ncbi:class III lanthionine synthetase LanKC [Herbidospora sp. RD11066]
MDDALPELMTFCQADPVFFEPLWRLDDHDTRFPTTSMPLPGGWRRGEQGLWTVFHPPGDDDLPDQGWKVHVSSTEADAKDVCERVAAFCLGRNLAVKFLRSGAVMRLLNSKYAERGTSGKLITLYPHDDTELADVLPPLAALLKDVAGPYILGDLRYEDGPLYVRYGAFRAITHTMPDGTVVYAMRTPGGDLVPDDRSPVFSVPEWVTPPDVLRESLARLHPEDAEEFPYQIERPLHFSNGGGVYLARGRETDGYVVLSEARPHAGIDAHGADAVTRLAREAAILERLDGLDCVPRVLDYRVIWEHHFLVEEYIEGTTLLEEVFSRYPLVNPDPPPEALAAYTTWATETLAKVDHALMAVHAKGVCFNDLHPANVIVRPDGRVALVDFEIASDLADPDEPGLAAPGFCAPEGVRGRAADDYVMDCLRQWMFLPITPLQELAPVKLGSLTEVVTRTFPVPPAFGRRLVRRFDAAHGPLGDDVPARLFEGEPDWPTIRDSLVAGIHASATPDREDRLFPGDPLQYSAGGFPVANGAAGVLWALHEVGATVPDEYIDWLLASVRRADDPRPGLLDGLHGVAAVLESLGRRDDALDLLGRARHDALSPMGLHDGLAGAGANLLWFASRTGDTSLGEEALKLGDRLAAALHAGPSVGRVGLQYGLTGVAHFFLRLYDTTADPRHLDLARLALRQEIDRGQQLPDGTFQLLEDNRYLTYLGTGSSGLALVLSQYLTRREEPAFRAVVDGARRACRAAFVRHPFLFMGRAGTIAALHLMGVPGDRPVVRDHIRRLGWHALSYQGHLAFPGNQLMRLSMDLGTGAAGILVALSVAFDRSASIIPVLDLRTSGGGANERK